MLNLWTGSDASKGSVHHGNVLGSVVPIDLFEFDPPGRYNSMCMCGIMSGFNVFGNVDKIPRLATNCIKQANTENEQVPMGER